MKTFLDDILAAKKIEISSLTDWNSMTMRRTDQARPPRNFEDALRKQRIGIIAEIKPKSPSCGVFKAPADPIRLALDYQQHGAAALSVLADRNFFGGSPELVSQIAHDPRITLPVLYKDFLIDERQIQLARLCGADAVLLIARALHPAQLSKYISLTHELEMAALVETFTAGEIRNAVAAGARLIGINNRDLQSFEVDLERGIRLASLLPEEIIKVSESGVSTPSDVARLMNSGFHGILVGEALLTAQDPGEALQRLLWCCY